MSADGDTVRLALHGDEISARAALARLEAAATMAESNQSLMEAYRRETQSAEAQRDALAEALRWYRDSPAQTEAIRARARAALAEAGLE